MLVALALYTSAAPTSRPDSADHKPKRGTDRPTSFAHDYIRNARSKCARRGANETYRHFVAGLLP